MSAIWGDSENTYSLGLLPPVTQKRHHLFAPAGPPTAFVSAGRTRSGMMELYAEFLELSSGVGAPVRTGLPRDRSKIGSRPRCQHQSAICGERQSRGHRCSPPVHKRNTRAFSWSVLGLAPGGRNGSINVAPAIENMLPKFELIAIMMNFMMLPKARRPSVTPRSSTPRSCRSKICRPRPWRHRPHCRRRCRHPRCGATAHH